MSEHDVRVEQGEKRVKVTGARGGEEGVDHFSLVGEIGVGNRCHSSHTAARAARELPCCSRGALHYSRNLVEGHGKDVVQHEREALGGSQGIEDHEQRETDRVGQQRLVLGVDSALTAHNWLRYGRSASNCSASHWCSSISSLPLCCSLRGVTSKTQRASTGHISSSRSVKVVTGA